MCGIVGLFAKTPALEERLGALLSEMLVEMTDRGPDSAGVALYRRPVEAGQVKVSIFDPEPEADWPALRDALDATFGCAPEFEVRGTHGVFTLGGEATAIRAYLAAERPDLRLMSAGTAIEIFKEKGLPASVIERFDLTRVSASHAIGHTRMATESAVTTSHSHPFTTGLDLCLVHNGSLSNHNRLRRELARHGVSFETDNDSEVAAGYLTWRLAQGDDIEAALAAAVRDLDGFYTFAVGTAQGFSVLRDPIACKHAVLAESDDWVAMATEYRSIATLPGAEAARIWEPKPGRVYSWGRAGHA
ncbi:MAG: amidophosphoribosyltransferase [Alphaproteobacteria bacterium]|jgi:amidophosphoribosyltransferase|nr:amidophosphoribosyltransferase [Alphaproteobacteria bacterium]